MYAQIALHALRADQLLQRGDAVTDPGQWPDSRVLQHQSARAPTGPVPYLLRLKHRYTPVGTELAHVVRGGQTSKTRANDSHVHMQAVCERV